MITAKDSTTIELKRIDDRMCAVLVDQPCVSGGKCLSRIVVLVEDLETELASIHYPPRQTELKADDTVRTCRKCGCTHDNPCPGGCCWTEVDLCSACDDRDSIPNQM